LGRVGGHAHEEVRALEQGGDELPEAGPHELGELLGRVEPRAARVDTDDGAVELSFNFC